MNHNNGAAFCVIEVSKNAKIRVDPLEEANNECMADFDLVEAQNMAPRSQVLDMLELLPAKLRIARAERENISRDDRRATSGSRVLKDMIKAALPRVATGAECSGG